MLIHTRLECFEKKVLEVLLEEGKKLQTWRGVGDGWAGRGGTGALKLNRPGFESWPSLPHCVLDKSHIFLKLPLPSL